MTFMTPGQQWNHNLMMNASPNYAMAQQMRELHTFGEVRSIERQKPQTYDFEKTPYPFVKRDPIASLARAEEDYDSSISASKFKPVVRDSNDFILDMIDRSKKSREDSPEIPLHDGI